jgi:hypothetical protein
VHLLLVAIACARGGRRSGSDRRRSRSTQAAVGFLVLIVGCGRISFDPLAPVDADLPTFDAAPCALAGTTTELVVADGSARAPALVAATGELGLAYWTPTAAQIVFRRVSQAGQPVGVPTLLAGHNTGAGNGSPAIAFTGGGFGISRAIIGPSLTGNFVMTALDAQGTRLAADSTISTFAYYAGAGALAWTGTSFGATWVAFDLIGGTEVGGWFARVDAAGARLDQGARITNFGDCLCTPELAWTGTQWLVVFDNDGLGPGGGIQIGLTRVAADGSVIAAPVEISDQAARTTQAPSIAWNGHAAASSWQQLDAVAEIAVVGFDDQGARLHETLRAGSILASAITALGDRFVVVFVDGTSLWLWTFDRDVQPIGDPELLTTLPASGMNEVAVAVAVIDRTVFVAWEVDGNLSITRAACQQ